MLQAASQTRMLAERLEEGTQGGSDGSDTQQLSAGIVPVAGEPRFPTSECGESGLRTPVVADPEDSTLLAGRDHPAPVGGGSNQVCSPQILSVSHEMWARAHSLIPYSEILIESHTYWKHSYRYGIIRGMTRLESLRSRIGMNTLIFVTAGF